MSSAAHATSSRLRGPSNSLNVNNNAAPSDTGKGFPAKFSTACRISSTSPSGILRKSFLVDLRQVIV